VVTPTYWTRAQDFGAADLLLPNLGSVERPLRRGAAQSIGHGMLGLHQIQEQLQRRVHAA